MKVFDFMAFCFPSVEYSHIELGISDSLVSRLHPQNWARSVITFLFLENTKKIAIDWENIEVALIGGTSNDPEVRAIVNLTNLKKVSYFGIEEGEWLDLNSLPTAQQSKFDFVICSQVLEHVWNHKNFFSHMSELVKQDGHLWLAAPASNRPHGLPSYYAAGFTDEYLSLNLMQSGFEIVAGGAVGTRRLYKALHTLPTWLSYKAHRWPIFFGFDDLPRKYRYFYRIRYFLRLTELLFCSGELNSSVETATESWCLARKL